MRGGLTEPQEWIDAQAGLQWVAWAPARIINLLTKIALQIGIKDP